MQNRGLATVARSSMRPNVGVLLQRKPLVMAPMTGFELDYHRFREERQAREQRPLVQGFYFKKGTPNESRWVKAQREGAGSGSSSRNNDSKMEMEKKTIVQPAEPELVEWFTQREAALPAQTADQLVKDVNYKSLERKPEESLFLFVKLAGEDWQLPWAPLNQNDQALHLAAPKALEKYFGNQMDYFVVGRVPVGHAQEGERTTFYMKAHIMAGKLVSSKEIKDHAWLTTSEVKELLKPSYYSKIQGIVH